MSEDPAPDVSPELPPPAAVDPEESTPIADGVLHHVAPQSVRVARISSWIVTAVVAAGLLVQLAVSLFGSLFRVSISFAATVVVTAILAWLSHRWPDISYRHTFYRVDANGLEIRRGVIWRDVINVPRARIQHTDVSQGPLQRKYGLGALVVYTAGTDHAKVELPGLNHARALRIRDHLLPSGGDDAV